MPKGYLKMNDRLKSNRIADVWIRGPRTSRASFKNESFIGLRVFQPRARLSEPQVSPNISPRHSYLSHYVQFHTHLFFIVINIFRLSKYFAHYTRHNCKKKVQNLVKVSCFYYKMKDLLFTGEKVTKIRNVLRDL